MFRFLSNMTPKLQTCETGTYPFIFLFVCLSVSVCLCLSFLSIEFVFFSSIISSAGFNFTWIFSINETDFKGAYCIVSGESVKYSLERNFTQTHFRSEKTNLQLRLVTSLIRAE